MRRYNAHFVESRKTSMMCVVSGHIRADPILTSAKQSTKASMLRALSSPEVKSSVCTFRAQFVHFPERYTINKTFSSDVAFVIIGFPRLPQRLIRPLHAHESDMLTVSKCNSTPNSGFVPILNPNTQSLLKISPRGFPGHCLLRRLVWDSCPSGLRGPPDL
jgi:hypothetical protein